DPGKQVIEFDRDPGGRISSLSILGPGHTMTADRFEPKSLGREQLADFCGDYYSQELGTAYSVTPGEDGLVAGHRRHEDTALVPVDEDTFQGREGRLGRIQFFREEGRVAGFLLTGGRVRNLRFDRIS
ncbi:MAG: hypothetical protein R6U70_04940, partial [Bacillota bacterium]